MASLPPPLITLGALDASERKTRQDTYPFVQSQDGHGSDSGQLLAVTPTEVVTVLIGMSVEGEMKSVSYPNRVLTHPPDEGGTCT